MCGDRTYGGCLVVGAAGRLGPWVRAGTQDRRAVAEAGLGTTQGGVASVEHSARWLGFAADPTYSGQGARAGRPSPAEVHTEQNLTAALEWVRGGRGEAVSAPRAKHRVLG